MKILVIGSGGREHALTWALAQDTLRPDLFSATTNAGIQALTTSASTNGASLNGGDPQAVAEFAAREKTDLVVVGPEQPLVDGVVDRLAERGIPAFGPTQAAARLEGSKIFSKEFMTRHRIPTARYRIADTAEEAFAALRDFTYPLVVKADGLAAGKGVIIASDEAEARQAIVDLMVERKLGAAGKRLLIEEGLVGREVSFLVFADGKDWRALPFAQDHKRAFDNDQGPNTGGMGAFSKPGLLDEALEQQIAREIIEPSLAGAAADGFAFRGVLYCGLMLTPQGPQVLEYNVRLGDPETQAILRRLDSSLSEICWAVARGSLGQITPRWSEEVSTCIVVASSGYPGSYATGKVISGLAEAEAVESVKVFHAGTRLNEAEQVVTTGGRVLGVTARGADLAQATARAYEAVSHIAFEGAFFRRDIGQSR